MAYAAVVSLMQILEDILGEQYQIPWEKQQIDSLLQSMCCFHDFLTRSWKKRIPDALRFEREIRDLAHKAEDVIEAYISEHFFEENVGEKLERSEIVSRHLKIVVEEVESIQLKVTQLEESWADDKDLHYTYYSPRAQPSTLASSGDYKVVFEDVSRQLMDRIVGGRSEKLQIIPVVGMGGSGKTTLVKYAFQDEYISHLFDVSAWVTVSQNYRKRDILLGLLEFMRRLTTEMHQQSDEDLSECLYKCLKSRRYLIVMDNVWHKEAWEEIKRLFPDDNMGSRVLLTTRLSDVATYANSSRHEHHLMLPLNENESWNLLHFKVFGDETSCPTELEEVGKKIARSCQGLPLSIVVISGLLSKVPRTLAEWESIANNLNSVLLSNDSQCSELLYFSYDHLPHHLKACFLYTGVFPLDLEIPISKLITLWIAEGFIKSNCSKRLEELGEEYLDDLMSRNLILVGEKGFDGKIKTCVVHDLLREWCLSKALEEMFIHTLNANTYNCPEVVGDPRHLCIRKDSSYEILADILGTTKTFPRVRSLLSQNNPHDKLRCCKLLRVLDLSKVDLEDFPRVILELVRLKCVSVCCDQEQEIYISEDRPDSLRNLQTLIIHQRCINSSVHLPRGIWRMPHLRHLQLGKCYFPHPQEGDKNSVLENLQTLSYVSGWSCTKEFIQGIPNIKKLGIQFEVLDKRRVLVSSIRHLGKLHKLEILKCIVEPGSYYNIAKDLTLPRNLKKLTLRGTKISWEDMSIVGSLPYLEVLKLKDYACEGSEWEPIEGEFCRLKFLYIEGTDLHHWRAEKDHFPILERLILFECTELEEIRLILYI
ncbi:putative late blight resistance protein homolog R1B-14 [Primulina tabacum]|uniref:putative late blight resistance protein homolog R1B-14 n=1 Tax=Primulina tabacum TaxID=48773 RepID=UPI003F5A3C6A